MLSSNFYPSTFNQGSTKLLTLVLLFFTFLFADVAYGQIPVFPDAEGHGQYSVGGRGGTIYRVTNLNSSGAGSLSDAVKATGPRTIVFEISGTIPGTITINNPYVTIAGQTAPSPGILLKGSLIIKAHNVLVQHIRVRSGLNGDDALKFGAGNDEDIHDVYLDHVSVSWGEDETMSVFQNNNGHVVDITIDHCIISEGLAKNMTFNEAKGFLINKGNSPNFSDIGPFTIVKTLFAHNNQRNPMINNGTSMVFCNNVIYGYRHSGLDVSGSGGTAYVSALNNVFKTRVQPIKNPVTGNSTVGDVYLSGNELDGSVPTDQSTLAAISLVSSSPLALDEVSLMSTQDVEDHVIDFAGARPVDRDPVDARVTNEVRTGTGDWMDQTEVDAAYPTLAVNTRTFSVSNPDGDDDGDGYTNLEEELYTMKLEVEGRLGTPSNTAPTISDIPDQTIDEDQTMGPVTFTIGDAETAASSLTLSSSSSNTTLVPNSAVVLGGSGASRTVTITPTAGQFGTSTITISVSDGSIQISDTFVLTVNEVSTGNTPPNLTNIASATIEQDQVYGPIVFTVSDPETPAGDLTLTGSSDNTTLVPNSGIVFGGSDGNRTITVTPAAGQFGQVVITVTLSDGEDTDVDTFVLTVNEAVSNNTPPTITSIANQTIDQDQSTGALSFTIGDAETAVGSLTLSATSTNNSLVPVSAITFAGSGANRTVTVTPAAGRTGSATITITVSDGEDQTSTSFVVNVNSVGSGNTAPTISSIADQTILQDATLGPLGFTVGDAETDPGTLTLSASSTNTALVPINSIIFGGGGANRDITVVPLQGTSGTTDITVTVSDGEIQVSETFLLTVDANTAPTVSSIADQVMDMAQTLGPLNFTVGDLETDPGALDVTARSSNTALLPRADVVLGGSGANRTVTITPRPDRSGSTDVTIFVSDGTAETTMVFNVLVNGPDDNTPPTISDIPDQTIMMDQQMGPIEFTIRDEETANSTLTLSGTSSNVNVVADENIIFDGATSTRLITIVPNTGAIGSTDITVTVSDGFNTTSDVFTLTVLDPDDPEISFSVTIQEADCQGQNGAIDLSVMGGVAPYSYQWSNGATTSSISDLSAGTYSLTVVDNAGTSRTASFVVNATPGPDKPTITQLDDDNLESTVAAAYEWYYNGEIIQGANDQVYTPEQTGDYSVMVYDESGCSSVSDVFAVDIVDTNVTDLMLYPIPVDDELNVELGMSDSPNRIGIAVFTMYGRPVFKKRFQVYNGRDFKTKLNLDRLRPGVYLIKIKINDELIMRKFIKV